ncbi:MAG: primosomal protein N' [Ruminococcaceae bacterium]|nr:primosomal protein N' [Oscillospiraceae bacterium]
MKGAAYAKVFLLDAPSALDRPFDYRIPEHLSGLVCRGSLVFVPFSAANKKRMGLVIEVCDYTESERTKDIIDVNLRVTFSEEQLAMCDFLKEYTLCTTGDAVRTVAPPLSALKSATNEKSVVYVRRTDAEFSPHGEKQKALYFALTDEFLPASELYERTGAGSAQLKALKAAGAAEVRLESVWRNPYADIKVDESRKNVLSAHQQKAFDTLCSLYDADDARCALLYGVTGSGKTRVMKAMIDHAVKSGKGVIVLVPEISLTPQTVGLFCSFYGDRVAVLHSSLSAGERYDAYRRIDAGEVDLVIGTRSAVFAPMKNLGMIIIDEEQEHTYKSDMSPKYHARDVAAFRLGRAKGLLLLASATPSVESYFKAKSGTYELVELTERYGSARLPEVYIDDIRKNALGGNLSPYGNLLNEKLRETLEGGDQAILFLNRRGYNAFLSCRDCGEAVLCPHCSVSLTRHKHGKNDTLLCHYCGYRSPIVSVCPSCKGEHLAFMGYGTQKVEEEFYEKFQGTIMRMDADTTTKKSAYDDMLARFRAHGADVLLGTQMVAKGHDFPDVTLVGVLNADSTLYMDDFRAGERTFSMLTQVIGRAGRAEKHGVAVIQTMNPQHEVIRLAAAQDYKAFYERDIKLRKAFTFPPYCDIAVFSITSLSETDCSKCAVEIFEFLKKKTANEYKNVPIISFGPFEATVYKIDERYRMRIVLKCRRSKQLLKLFSEVVCTFGTAKYKNVTCGVDINPTGI